MQECGQLPTVVVAPIPHRLQGAEASHTHTHTHAHTHTGRMQTRPSHLLAVISSTANKAAATDRSRQGDACLLP